MSSNEIDFLMVQQWLQEYKNAAPDAKKRIQKIVVTACLPMVKKIAHGLARRSTDPVDDIIQVGSLGLFKAIQLYKPEVGTSFKTYATYFITGEIKHYIRDKISMIKPPREIQELAYRINMLTKKLTEQNGEPPTNEELANELSIPVAKMEEIIEGERRSKQTISLEQTIFEAENSSLTLNDTLADENYENNLNLKEDKIMLMQAIKKLPETYQQILKMNFFEDLNQRQISEKLGISQMQVSRFLKKALSELFVIITEKSGYEE